MTPNPESFADDKWKQPVEAPGIRELMGRRPRLLVVDDEPANILALFRLFSDDHQVFMATSGAQVLAVCEEKKPDLVLMDIEMPDIDGFDVCAQMQSNPLIRHIPVIFVTSHNDPAIEARGLALGGVDFITKPVSRDIVRARVRTHLVLKQQTDMLRQWVYIDGLTGVFNRRHFDERLAAEWGRAHRHGSPLSVLMIDVDRFKPYNDNYGHQRGDEVLRDVAGTLKQVLKRSSDLVARYGGEEFVCLLPETDATGATKVASMLNEAVRALSIEHAYSPPANVVTVSIGGATYRSNACVNALELMKIADGQLYKAKESGRNGFFLIDAARAKDMP